MVGAGSAGCVMARRLSDEGSQRVLLLEAGKKDSSPLLHVPAGLLLLDDRFDWQYTAEPDESRNGLEDTWYAGKVLGGGSAVNGMMFVRGNPLDFDHWRDLGCEGWDYESVLDSFMRSESWQGSPRDARGRKGPQAVSQVRSPHPLAEKFIRSSEAVGYVFNPDSNGRRQEGVGWVQASQKNGWRKSAFRAYVAPVLRQRRNLEAMTETQVSRILFEGTRAIGVEVIVKGTRQKIFARREVIVSAGAIGSPTLLMRSGIGPGDHLKAHGVSVIADRAEVGQNLQEHPIVPLSWETGVSTLNTEITLSGVLRHGLNFALRGRGAATSPVGHAQIFLRTREELELPDIQLIFSPMALSAENPEIHDIHGLRPHPEPAVSAYVCMLHPTSRGEICLRSGGPDSQPIIRHRLIDSKQDVEQLVSGCEIARKVFSTDPLSGWVGEEFRPGPDVEQMDDWLEYFARNAFRGDHPVGTCRMGSDTRSVVDTHLRVREVSGLRVVDASIMPSLTSGNTNAPVLMLAERAAEILTGE